MDGESRCRSQRRRAHHWSLKTAWSRPTSARGRASRSPRRASAGPTSWPHGWRVPMQIAEATGAPLVVEDGLVEADFGAWEGLTFAEAGERWPDELAAWMASPDAAPPDGESFAMVALRVLAAADRLIEAHRHERAVVVSHVTPIKTLVCRALLAPPEAMFRMNLDVASLTLIDCHDNGSATLRSLNDTAHLQPRRRRRTLLAGRG